MPSAERVRWAKTRVASVCIAAVMILGTLCYLLTGGTLLEAKSTLYLYMPDAVGLVAGAPVRVDGIGVGKVASVALSGLNQPLRVVKVTLTVERDRLASIPDDSTAQASADTLVGDKFVDVSSGRSPSRIRAGGEITYKAEPELTKRVDVAELENRLRAMDALLTDIEAGQSPLGKFVKDDEMYQSLRRRVADLQGAIHVAADTTTQVGQLLFSDAMYRKVSEPLRRLDQDLARVQSGQTQWGHFLRDDAQYLQLRSAARDAGKAVAEMRRTEFVSSDRQYAEWNRGVQSMIRQVDEFAASPALGSTAPYENLNGMALEVQSAMREFRENPKKFLRLKVF
jgi:phospholipid/cholesterol/gamma-HCH transport system substrate-binding protein